MRKRKINPQYLRRITSQDVKDESIDTLEFADSLKRFADEYLAGIMSISIDGVARGSVTLKLPVASYLIRLLCECGDSDEFIEARISLGDELTLSVSYKNPCPSEDVAQIVKVAKLAGFEVKRYGNLLFFSADVSITSIMQIYAVSAEEFFEMLVITHKM